MCVCPCAKRLHNTNSRPGDEHSLRDGDGPVRDDRTADVYPGGGDGSRHGPSGAGKRPHNTGTQPQLTRVRRPRRPDTRHTAPQHNGFPFFSGSSAAHFPDLFVVCFSGRNLYPKFASPWASAPCRPQDIGTTFLTISSTPGSTHFPGNGFRLSRRLQRFLARAPV